MKKLTQKKNNQKNQKPKTASAVESDPQLKHFIQTFYQLIGDMNSQADSQVFLSDFLTESEIKAFAKRLAIAVELESGKSYERIRAQYAVSTATISVVSEMMSKPGMILALKKIKTDHWADNMSDKIIKFFQK